MCFSSPSVPSVPAPIKTPTEADPSVQAAVDDERRRRAAAAGQASTLLTGGAGLPSATATNGKTLLGQ